MITYNHELFIREAIEGVLMQKCNFLIELIIGDDCSTDNTLQICKEYELKYSEINLLQSYTNLGMMPNFIRTLASCTGKYIALCEGDDYWTDPYKLQKQVDFLQTNSDYIACFHNARIINISQKLSLFNSLNENNYPTTEDIINRRWFIATASLMFRNNVITLPDWFLTVVNGDYALELLLAQKGKFYYMDDVMAVYRQHKDSSSAYLNSKTIFLYSKLIELYKYLINVYDTDYREVFSERINFFTVEKEKEFKLLKYPFLIYLDWRFYKRNLFRYLRIKRDIDD